MEIFTAIAVFFAGMAIERGLTRIAEAIESLSFDDDEEEEG